MNRPAINALIHGLCCLLLTSAAIYTGSSGLVILAALEAFLCGICAVPSGAR